MCPALEIQFRENQVSLTLPSRRWWVLAVVAASVAALAAWPDRPLRSSPDPRAAAASATAGGAWRDRFGDGWPDAARLSRPEDRDNFRRWVTYLAESAFYRPTPASKAEVNDCAALIRFAYRNALVEHSAGWRQSLALAAAPGFGDIGKFVYPAWPLGRGLFRTEAGPFQPSDLARPVFQEFADARSLMRFNAFAVSRDLRAARPGDMIFFHQPEQTEPFHVMLFVGRSHFQPQGSDWIVYHTGSVNGTAGEVRHVQASVLAQHPEARWRPVEGNRRFLGVYRFSILR
jgi:hypothetical protein